MTDKMNCWEYKKCGHDVAGDCPAYPRGGRCCYLVESTVCDGKRQGGYLLKIDRCRLCEFYSILKVDEEAGKNAGS